MSSESEENSSELVMVATWTDPAAVELLEAALPNAAHLKPLWERILVYTEGGRACIGLPITAKVTDDSVENHARHLYSLFNLLGLPLVPSPMALKRVRVPADGARPLIFETSESATAEAATPFEV
jgi:hypothetical protein